MRTRRSLLVVFALLFLIPAYPVAANQQAAPRSYNSAETRSSGEGLALSQELPKKAYVSGFAGRAQRYVLSCESRSAVDWAAFWGINISETEFLNKLPQSLDPEIGFVGNANDPWGFIPPRSYGVHARPVSDLLNDYGLQTTASKGLKWEDLRTEIAAGRPVIVWIIGQMWSGTPLKYRATKGSDPTIVANFEHTMTLVGYTPQRVQVVDSYTGFEHTYPLAQFLSSWSVLGNMAITGTRPYTPPGESHSSENIYQVQSGDNLVKLAEQTGIPLEQLAELNQIQNPHQLVVGSLLRLPPPVTVPGSLDLASPDTLATRQTIYLPVTLQIRQTAQGASTATTPAAQDAGVTYVVQTGDFLIDIANQYGVDWRTLALLNSIPPPYRLTLGQVLRIR